MKEKQNLDKFHYHEALDRAYMLGGIVEEHLLGHPVIQENKCIKNKVNKSLRLLAEIYQDIGKISIEKFEEPDKD